MQTKQVKLYQDFCEMVYLKLEGKKVAKWSYKSWLFKVISVGAEI